MFKSPKTRFIVFLTIFTFVWMAIWFYVIQPYLFSEAPPKLWIFLLSSAVGSTCGTVVLYFIYDPLVGKRKKDNKQTSEKQ